MRLRDSMYSRLWRRGFAGALCAALLTAEPAAAFDFFGLWPDSDAPPAASAANLPYVVAFKIVGAEGVSESVIRDASNLQALRKDPPEDGVSLARRAGRDFAPIVDALWSLGYYDASLDIRIDGVDLPLGVSDGAAFARAAEGYRARAPVPIEIVITPGPLFKLRELRLLGVDGAPLVDLPDRVVALKAGDPAAASALRALQTRIVDEFRARGRPLARIVKVAPTINHPGRFMDLTLVVDPGARANMGTLTITGPRDFDPLIARSFVYMNEGDPYSPKTLADTKTSVREIPAVGSVRIVEADRLDSHGELPLSMDVGDRLGHAVGVAVKYSSVDGPAAQVYWENRNVFGGAEFLRLEANLLYAPANSGSAQRLGGISDQDIGGRVAAHFMKPALGGSRDDLLVDAYAERASTNAPGFVGYTVNDADLAAAIRHRFSRELSMQIGLDAQAGQATDALGAVNYRILGAPVSVTYDSTDDKLDPTRGFRASGSFAPYPMFLGSSLNLYQVKARASAYFALDSDARFVLAGRANLGAEFGSALDQIPANLRYFAGGGGSVRGYAFSSLGPTAANGAIVGGRSVADGSLEMRVRATQTIGFVAFVDAGQAFAGGAPDFSRPLGASVGLGLRYFTSFGPLRLDIATPIERRSGDRPFAIYASVGQAF